MVRRLTEVEERKQADIEQLIEALESGVIDGVEDLSREEVALLLTRTRPGESLQDLFDRLRVPSRDFD